MAKGLAVARIFYRAGHVVVGADFEDENVGWSSSAVAVEGKKSRSRWGWSAFRSGLGKLWVPGRWSRSLESFHRLPDLQSRDGSGRELGEGEMERKRERYTLRLLEIVEDEEIDLWASVSSDKSALEDAEIAELIEESTKGRCKTIQFGHTLTETLHDKFSFIANTRRIGLNVPDTHLVTSEAEAMGILYPEEALSNSSSTSNSNLNLNLLASEKESLRLHTRVLKREAGLGGEGKEYIMKSITLDSANRSDMTLLPRARMRDTEAHIKRLNPTPFRPYVLQSFVRGREYCAHSLIIDGHVRAFVACPSKELLVHYTALPSSSLLSLAMEKYLRLYAHRTKDLEEEGRGMTGHFSVDFLVEEDVAYAAENILGGVSEKEVDALVGRLLPIECNPRANTAVLLFEDVAEELADAYLSVLKDDEKDVVGFTNGVLAHTVPPTNQHRHHRDTKIVYPSPSTPSYYWAGHDLVTLVFLPLLDLLVHRKSSVSVGLKEVAQQWLTFLSHIFSWRDGVYAIWDPWPFWWMYVVYWPTRLVGMMLEGRKGWWGRVNLGTGKVFGC